MKWLSKLGRLVVEVRAVLAVVAALVGALAGALGHGAVEGAQLVPTPCASRS